MGTHIYFRFIQYKQISLVPPYLIVILICTHNTHLILHVSAVILSSGLERIISQTSELRPGDRLAMIRG